MSKRMKWTKHHNCKNCKAKSLKTGCNLGFKVGDNMEMEKDYNYNTRIIYNRPLMICPKPTRNLDYQALLTGDISKAKVPKGLAIGTMA